MDNKFGAFIALAIIVVAAVLVLGFNGNFDPAPVEMQKHKVVYLERNIQLDIIPIPATGEIILNFYNAGVWWTNIHVPSANSGLVGFGFSSRETRTITAPATKSIVITMTEGKFGANERVVNTTVIDTNHIDWDYEPKC